LLAANICPFAIVAVVSSNLLFLCSEGSSLDRVIASSFIVNLLNYRVKRKIALYSYIASYDLSVFRIGVLNREDELVDDAFFG
jgi:hypothetical protein